MGTVLVADELQRIIERQAAEGRAASTSAFVEEAVLRLIEDAKTEHTDLMAAVNDGIADIEAGRFVTIATADDGQRLHQQMVQQLQDDTKTAP